MDEQRPQEQTEIRQEKPQEYGGLSQNVKLMWGLIIGIVVVLFVAFVATFIAVGGMIVNYEAERQATYQGLKDQVITQNAKIDALTNALQSKGTIPR